MELATIARPYALACFHAVAPAARVAVALQLDTVALAMQLPTLKTFVQDPRIGANTLIEVFRASCKEDLHKEVENLLILLIENNRLAALSQIASQFHQLKARSEGVAEARIESAFEITPPVLEDLLSVAEKKFSCRLRAQVVLRPDLIGGVRIVVGDEVWDTSVRAQLDHMQNSLTV